MFDAVKTSTSGLSIPVAVLSLSADSGSALPDLRPSATVVLRAPPALSDAPLVRLLSSVVSDLPPDGFPWLSPPEMWQMWTMSDAAKASSSGLSMFAAATYPVIVPFVAVDSGSALPDLQPSATVALRAPPALSDAPWVRLLSSVVSDLPPDGFPWLSPTEMWKIWTLFDAVKTSMSGLSRSAAATYHVIVPLAAVNSGSALPDL